MKNRPKTNPAHWLLLALLTLVGILPRILFPDWTEFKADEARLHTLALRFVETKQLPLRGIDSSVGLPNFGASVWMFALPLFLFRHVYAPTIFVGLLNGIAVVTCYLFGRKYWNQTAGFISAFLYATAPWAIMHSRKIWAQNLLLFVTMLWAITLYKAVIDGRKRWFIATIALAFFAFQIHLSAVTLLFATAIVALMFWRKIGWQSLLLGIITAFITFIPFLLYLSRTPLPTDSVSNRSLEIHTNIFPHAIRLMTGWQIHALAGAEEYENYLASTLNPLIPQLCVGGLLLGGLALFLWRFRTHLTPNLLLILWATIPLFGFFIFPSNVEIHYLLPLYPAWFLLAGVGWSYSSPKIRPWLLSVVVLAGMWQLLNTAHLIRFVAYRPTPHGFGSILGDHLAAVERLNDYPHILIVGDGENRLTNSFAAIYDSLLYGQDVRFVDGRFHAVFPQGNTGVLLQNNRLPVAPLYRNMTAVSSQKGDFEMLVGSTDGTHPFPDGLIKTKPFENGVQMQGYSFTDAIWQLHWTVGQPSSADVHIYNHLFDEAGNRFAQQDSSLFSPSQWREGDWVISSFSAELESAELVRLGLYYYPDSAQIPLFPPESDTDWQGIIEINLP